MTTFSTRVWQSMDGQSSRCQALGSSSFSEGAAKIGPGAIDGPPAAYPAAASFRCKKDCNLEKEQTNSESRRTQQLPAQVDNLRVGMAGRGAVVRVQARWAKADHGRKTGCAQRLEQMGQEEHIAEPA
jgi:hypothetical protein